MGGAQQQGESRPGMSQTVGRTGTQGPWFPWPDVHPGRHWADRADNVTTGSATCLVPHTDGGSGSRETGRSGRRSPGL